jgi:hypothetical protein
MAAALCAAPLLGGCGQKGPLYMPDQATEIVTRPMRTPPGETPSTPSPAPTPPATPPPAQNDAPNTPQTVDKPLGPDNPAPEVTAPDDSQEKEPGAPTPRK